MKNIEKLCFEATKSIMENFYHALPKNEYHSHLGGSIPESLLQDFIKEKYPKDFKEIFKKCRIGSNDDRELDHCFDLFKYLHEAMNSKSNLSRVVREVLNEYVRENTLLCEIRSTPRKMEDGDKEDYMHIVLSIMNEFNKKYEGKFFCGYIVSVNRSKSLEEAKENLVLFEKFKGMKEYENIMLGIDFSGNCFDNRMAFYEEVFTEIKKKGIKTTIHLAEFEDKSDSTYILNYKPDRVGHACYLGEKNTNKLLESKIPLEICITSNIKSRSVKNVADHHFKLYYKKGHPISLNTDDKGLFSNSLTTEYETVGKVFKLTEKELFDLSFNSINHSFFNDDIKKNAKLNMKEFQKKYFV